MGITNTQHTLALIMSVSTYADSRCSSKPVQVVGDGHSSVHVHGSPVARTDGVVSAPGADVAARHAAVAVIAVLLYAA